MADTAFSFYSTFLFLILIVHYSSSLPPASPPPVSEDCNCIPPPPPKPLCPPPPSPPPSPFPSYNVERDYYTIKDFRNKLLKNPDLYDPKGIARTWENKDVCNYQGFACEKLPKSDNKSQPVAVAAVDFNQFGFGGPELMLTDFLGKLFDLAIFHANSNNFTGVTPHIGQNVLRFLYELDLSNNKYKGNFPSSVLKANLSFLDIRFNEFCGPIPREVFTLDLDVLFLNNNKFTQCIPDNLGSTPALYLTFANNNFTGPIPRSIGNCTKLREVLFLGNQLTGCLPYEIGMLGKELQVFDAGTNQLTGPIPQSFACLKKLEILNLANNEFYGEVPELLCQLPKMENLSLSHNFFTLVGPECMNLIKRKRLDVRMNCILGLPNQKTPEECAEFFCKHRTCPNERSLNFIPCRSKSHVEYSEEKSTLESRKTVAARSSRTYDALKPHKLKHHKLRA